MNILVIGNGFDLAHGLPTSYKNFLDFCERARRIYTFNEKATIKEYEDNNLSQWEMDDYIKEQLALAFRNRECQKNILENGRYGIEVITQNESLNELYGYIKHNTWLEYFWNCPSYIGENWIDFELEISRVIKALDVVREWVKKNNSMENLEGDEGKIITAIWKASKWNWQKIFRGAKEIEDFANFLDLELEKLTRALEIYIARFVGEITIKKSSEDIEMLKTDHVLSFNYSNTYKRKYEKDEIIKYDYIHGEAKIDTPLKCNNMVLGIDEYLLDDRKNKDVEFIAFKKFYQRIYKGTGCNYKKWLDEINEENEKYNKELLKAKAELTKCIDVMAQIDKEDRYKYLKNNSPKHNLYIYGHSLDVTDKDILRDLILTENMYTTIFYFERRDDNGNGDNGRKDLGQKIANLVKVIEQDELIKRTGGSKKTIQFKLQQDMTEKK